MTALQEYVVPQENINDEYAVVLKTHLKTGEKVRAGVPVAEIEFSKSSVLIEAEHEGFVEYFSSQGDQVAIGRTLFKIHRSWDEKRSERLQVDSAVSAPVSPTFSKRAAAYMHDHAITTDAFHGADFVTLETITGKSSSAQKDTKRPKLPTKIEKLSPTKSAEIVQLSDIQKNGLRSTIHIAVRAKTLLGDHKGLMTKSMQPIVVYYAAGLLKKYPRLNAFFWDKQIEIYEEIHVGVAFDLGMGLYVAKLPDTTRLSIGEIEEKIYELSLKYVEKKFSPDDTGNITFTVTDLSSFGPLLFTPLIPQFQSAILGISGYDADLDRIHLSLSFDHRVSQGREAALFLKDLKTALEAHAF